MAKILYETALLICSSCVIFTGTLSAVLLMLAWPNDRILGLSTRLVIGLCIIIVAIFSIGFVGTIAESIRALLIFACLLILFPVSILLVEIIFRLSTLSPAPVTVSPSIETMTTTISSQHPAILNKSQTLIESKLLSTKIYSNSLTSDKMNPSARMKMPQDLLLLTNTSRNSISASPQSTLYVLLPSPLHPSYLNPMNLSTSSLSSSPTTTTSSSSSSPVLPSQPILPTDFYLLFKDDSSKSERIETQSSNNNNKNNNNNNNNNNTQQETNQILSSNNVDNINKKHVKYLTTVKPNFWSNIITTTLSPQVETLVEYVLIGMLAFVLFQIVIAYLLASEIQALRAELSLFASRQLDKSEEEIPNLLLPTTSTTMAAATAAALISDDVSMDVGGREKDLTFIPLSEVNNFSQFEPMNTANSSGSFCVQPNYSYDQQNNYDLLDQGTMLTIEHQYGHAHPPSSTHHHHQHHQQQLQQQQQQHLIEGPLVQVHVNPDLHSSNLIPSKPSNEKLSTLQPLLNDNKQSQFASSLSSNDSLTRSRANRRLRTGSFRVTFETAPEYVPFEPNENEQFNGNCVDTNYQKT